MNKRQRKKRDLNLSRRTYGMMAILTYRGSAWADLIKAFGE